MEDKRSGQNFGQEEERLGYNTGGEYQVQLPDGRRQIVTYVVEDENSGYIADVSYKGESKNLEKQEIVTSDDFSPPLPPIRSKPSVPRSEKSLNPKRTLSLSPEEVRFISRPTKIVPTIIKILPDIQRSELRSHASNLNKKAPAKNSKPKSQNRKTLPRLVQRPIKSQNVASIKENSRNSKKLKSEKVETIESEETSNTVKKPISAMKSLVRITTTTSPPPVYIPSKAPKLSYKEKYHTAESQVLYSLFREDINGKEMKPPSKEPKK